MKLVKPIAAFGLAVLAIVFLAVVLLSPQPPAPLPLPKPNGYDDLVKAGRMLSSDAFSRDDLSAEEMRTLVAQNADALGLARAGLQKECRVPLEYSMTFLSNHLSDLAVFKRLARGFLAEGKWAEGENRYADAGHAFLDTVRLGHECGRGGVIIDMLVGVACQSLGCRALEGLRDHLAARECREVIHQLEDMDLKAESQDEVARQERSWSRRTFGWRAPLSALVMRQSLRQTEQKAAAKLQAQQRATRLLCIELAARAYELERGQRPTTVADLVPAYLKTIPQDPLTGTDMVDLP